MERVAYAVLDARVGKRRGNEEVTREGLTLSVPPGDVVSNPRGPHLPRVRLQRHKRLQRLERRPVQVQMDRMEEDRERFPPGPHRFKKGRLGTGAREFQRRAVLQIVKRPRTGVEETVRMGRVPGD